MKNLGLVTFAALLLSGASGVAQDLTGDNLTLTGGVTAAGLRNVFGSDDSNAVRPYFFFPNENNAVVIVDQRAPVTGGAQGPYSGFVFINNQQSAGGKNVAQLMFVNSAIPNGSNNGNSKRVVQIMAQTGSSSINSGQLILRTFNGNAINQLKISETGDVTIGALAPADLFINGETSSTVVEIRGGADIAEPFNVSKSSSSEYDVEPGVILCIDPDNPGQLMMSTRAYDRTVAGIVSGAGGLNAGLILGQKDSIASGKYPVAMTGRVYCKVDASEAAVRPGDLLTTSDKPGYGMKVLDHPKATGAIIGKAMTSLEQGEQGLVLVLVSLQ